MPWMTISEYQETHFTKRSRPSRNTVKARIMRGDLVGKKMGGQWYVDPDVTSIATDNELVLRVLREA